MTTNEYLDRIRDALRSEQANTPSGQAVARLKQPFVLGDGEKWHYEGFVSMFSAIRHALASLDNSISPDLPPFLLDPATVARLFGIPLAEFNWQGYPTDNALVAQLLNRDRELSQEAADGMASQRKLITPRECQRDRFQNKISLRQVYGLFYDGEIDGFRVGRKVLLFDDSVEAYISRNRNKSVARDQEPKGDREPRSETQVDPIRPKEGPQRRQPSGFQFFHLPDGR